MHWTLAAGFVGAFAVAHLFEHRPAFAAHMLLGAIAAVAVILGLVGSRHARFASLAFGPAAVVRYLRSALVGPGERHAGHNPANAWVAVAILASTLGVAVTGALNGSRGHAAKEVHEALVEVTLVLVGMHVVGLALHTFRRRENVALGMIDGKKAASDADAIPRAHAPAAAAMLAVVGLTAFRLVNGYDPANRRAVVLGQTIQIGGEEKGEGEGGRHDGRRGKRSALVGCGGAPLRASAEAHEAARQRFASRKPVHAAGSSPR